MPFIRGLLLVEWTFTWVGYGQCGDDDDRLGETMKFARRKQHTAEARNHRQYGELTADPRERAPLVHCTELLQQLIGRIDLSRVRRIDEGKVHHIADAERGNLLYDRREIGAQYLVGGEG